MALRISLIRHGASIGDAKLWYDKARKTFYVHVSLEIDVPEPTCDRLGEVVGVDVGIRYLAVTSTSTGKASFHPGIGRVAVESRCKPPVSDRRSLTVHLAE